MYILRLKLMLLFVPTNHTLTKYAPLSNSIKKIKINARIYTTLNSVLTYGYTFYTHEDSTYKKKISRFLSVLAYN